MLAGLAAGGVLALGGAQLLRRFLHGLSPFDPLAYLQIATILLAAAALATWIPARRAARVDPAVTLRTD
jgi:ABC-type lipoprotein release transport system permease subunit